MKPANDVIKLLLVDDDLDLTRLLQEYLQQENFDVEVAHDGETALQLIQIKNFDLLVLDIMMPGITGVDVLSRLRQTSQVPVLMLTGRGDDIDRIIGLELGADDYVPKPCTPRELVARIRAILRRIKPEPVREYVSDNIKYGDLMMQPESRQAHWQLQPLELTSAEFNLLELLAQNGGQVVSKEFLSEKCLGRPLSRYDRSIDVHMSSIRGKLGKLADGRSCIQTVRGVGYQLIRDAS